MRISILGLGNVGGALAKGWSATKHELYAGVRSPATTQAPLPGLKIGSISEACHQADIFVLSIPWNGVPAVLEQTGDISGKILVDCCNPLKEDLIRCASKYNSFYL